MEKFSKEMLRKLANQVMFDLNDQECEELQEEFETYLKQLDLLNKRKWFIHLIHRLLLFVMMMKSMPFHRKMQ